MAGSTVGCRGIPDVLGRRSSRHVVVPAKLAKVQESDSVVAVLATRNDLGGQINVCSLRHRSNSRSCAGDRSGLDYNADLGQATARKSQLTK